MSEDASQLPFQPSLAQATNTRVDSACKHIQQCRVSTDDMLRLANSDANEIQRNKYRYCVHKDELVVGIGRAWNSSMVMKRVANSAYPRVLSNLGCLDDSDATRDAIMMIRFMNHFARSIDERKKIIQFFMDEVYTTPVILDSNGHQQDLPPACQAFKCKEDGKMGTRRHMPLMYDYFTVGFANTLGYAHANSGDTMTSVMIGGLRTVMNGDFEIFAGDPVQFYWCFEKEDFERDGSRKPYLDIWDHSGNQPGNVDPSTVLGRGSGSYELGAWQNKPDAQLRQTFFDLSYGQRRGVTKLVAKIKPYVPDEENPRLNDWYRVFGTAIASARPNEMCDIKISRQSA